VLGSRQVRRHRQKYDIKNPTAFTSSTAVHRQANLVPGQPQLIFQSQILTKNNLSSSIETERVDSRGFPDEEPHFGDEGYLSNKEGQQSEEGE